MSPPSLNPSHATIAVATPASPPKDLAAFSSGVAFLRSLGFTVKTGRQDFPTEGYLCGSDALRADEFNTFIRDPEVDAIFCTRGGYGSLRILPAIDYAAASNHSKLLVGYSDITALQLALHAKAGWRSVSGPMVAVEWSEGNKSSEDRFWKLVSGGQPAAIEDEDGQVFTAIKEGDATGILLGGNLAVLMKLVGTPYLPDMRGAILFIEDVNEPAYKIDGMLAHLKLADIWDHLGGLVLGQFTDQHNPTHTSPEILAVFKEYCNNVTFPVASGLRYGHIPVKIPMPIGIQARLKVTQERSSLSFLEPLVANHSS